MRYYAPYLVALSIVIMIVAALFHHGYKSSSRDYKYGNPEHEKLIQECRHIEDDAGVRVTRLYGGYSEVADSYWYSVTVEMNGKKETQIFASFDTPVIDRISSCKTSLELKSGKKTIVIPVKDIEGRMKVPLVFYRDKELKENFWSADKM